MGGDPADESRLDSFSLVFPLPYRVAFLVVLGVWGWGFNLHYLHFLHIDVPSLIRYPQRSGASQLSHHHSTYRLATLLSATLASSILVFWLFTRGDPDRVVGFDWWPVTCLVALAALFVLPLRSLAIPHTGRKWFLRALRRVSVGGIAEAKDGRFGDVILADALTSYAKVLADLFVCLCMFLARDGGATGRPDRSCGGAVIVPLVMAMPSAIRLRQCLVEYFRVRRGPSSSAESAGRGGQHLANAAKYASAFPVIVFSSALRSVPAEDQNLSGGLYRAWALSLLVNSLYSFYWDVAKDWDLTLFSGARERSSPEHPYGLRSRLLIDRPAVYYGAVAVDLLLRCAWMAKLNPHQNHHTADYESSIFITQFLEVFRRWMWIFFRVEAEWLRSNSNGLGADDVLLGNYLGKYEDEEDY